MQASAINATDGGINDIFDVLPSLIQQTTESMKQNIQDMKTTMSKNNGMLDPIQMNQLQMMTQVYGAIISTWSSLVKQVGDTEKSIANNIGT